MEASINIWYWIRRKMLNLVMEKASFYSELTAAYHFIAWNQMKNLPPEAMGCIKLSAWCNATSIDESMNSLKNICCLTILYAGFIEIYPWIRSFNCFVHAYKELENSQFNMVNIHWWSPNDCPRSLWIVITYPWRFDLLLVRASRDGWYCKIVTFKCLRVALFAQAGHSGQ